MANIPLANIPFVLGLGAPNYFHDEMYPNHIYRRLHARQHDPLDIQTLGKIALLGAHAAHRYAGRNGEMTALSSNSKNKKDFEVNLDVGLFAPEELTVKVVDNCVIVEGKHEEREDDNGYISRHFVRRYHLPEGLDANAITSSVSADGVLTIHAPLPDDDKPKERIIPIKSVGPSDLFLKCSKNEKNDAVEQNGQNSEKK